MTADSKSRFSVVLLLGFFLTSSEDVGALELTGAWAASADQCGKVFTRKGRANAIAFTELSERHGGGFVIETLNLIAGCTTDIILSNVQFSLKVLDENSIARQFPGMEGSEVKYFRCPI